MAAPRIPPGLLLVGAAVAGLGILYLITRPGEKGAPSVVQNLAAGAGNAVGSAVPQIVLGSIGGAIQGFSTSSYNQGFATGQAIDQALKTKAQIVAETAGVPLPSNFNSLTPAQQTATFEKAYAKTVNPFFGTPTLPNVLAASWHSFLTGDPFILW